MAHHKLNYFRKLLGHQGSESHTSWHEHLNNLDCIEPDLPSFDVQFNDKAVECQDVMEAKTRTGKVARRRIAIE